MLKQLLGRGWRSWVEIAGYFGDFQARLLLTIFYVTIFVPFALIMRLLSDPLRVRKIPVSSGWITRHDRDADLQASRQQF